MRALTERQAAILAYMREYQAANGAPPTLREIAEHFKIASTNGVADHLKAMAAKGAVRAFPGRARGYVPT